MRIMNNATRKILETEIQIIMSNAMDEHNAKSILESKSATGRTVMDAIVDDVMECSAWDNEGFYNSSDIRFAIGRVLSNLVLWGLSYRNSEV